MDFDPVRQHADIQALDLKILIKYKIHCRVKKFFIILQRIICANI